MTRLSGKVDKGWGYELIWSTNDKYAGKILFFTKKGNKFSMHFHKEKDETWFVNSGKFKVRYVNTESGEILETELDEGHTFNVPALMPIQICSLGVSGSISEVSDKPDDEDIYVCLKSSYLG